MALTFRPATPADIPAQNALIERSARILGDGGGDDAKTGKACEDFVDDLLRAHIATLNLTH